MKSVGKIIATYRKKAKYTQPMLAQKLAEHGIKISHITISGWEQGVSEPSISTFLCICMILGIPDCVEEMYGSNPSNPMTLLNEAGKEKVAAYIDTLVHPASLAREPNAIEEAPVRNDVSAADESTVLSFRNSYRNLPAKKQRTLRLYDVPVSAGTGEFMTSDRYSLVTINEDEYVDADFAVSVNGNSMEPLFSDHSIVYVHQQQTLRNGEIGVFYLNGDAYIKQLQDNAKGVFLISLNKEYAPIPVNPEWDSFRIFGRVCRA